MRTAALALLLATAACTDPAPETANAANEAASNTFAEMDSAATPAYDAANLANGADPDAPVASMPVTPGEGATTNMTTDPDADACGASKLQNLVGKPRSAIPPNLPPRTRVACTTCPVTMDYSPERLNIFYDEKTDIIKEVRCG